MRITSAHIRDLQRFVSFPFLRAPFNLPDVGAKYASNVNAWETWMSTGLFNLGFVPREECKSALSPLFLRLSGGVATDLGK